MTADEPIGLTREILEKGSIHQLIRERDGDSAGLLTEEQLIESRRGIVPDNPSRDVWVFAYGSLIWNPALKVKEKRLGRIHGYHRRFCLKTRLGRGSPENPGLILGLDRGGCCQGMALRIDRRHAGEELDLLWKREMLNKSYIPRILKVRCDNGSGVEAICFVINRDAPAYVADLSVEEKARMIATASGFIGPCIDYLENTHAGLAKLSIHDRYLDRILKLVRG